MYFCDKCGFKTDTAAQFCRNCGNNSMSPPVVTKLANLFRGLEAVGGHLYLTKCCLYFSSHCLNVQTGDTIISYDEISRIEKCNTLRIVPNGLLIVTKNGIVFLFVLWGREKVISCLKQLMSAREQGQKGES